MDESSSEVSFIRSREYIAARTIQAVSRRRLVYRKLPTIRREKVVRDMLKTSRETTTQEKLLLSASRSSGILKIQSYDHAVNAAKGIQRIFRGHCGRKIALEKRFQHDRTVLEQLKRERLKTALEYTRGCRKTRAEDIQARIAARNNFALQVDAPMRSLRSDARKPSNWLEPLTLKYPPKEGISTIHVRKLQSLRNLHGSSKTQLINRDDVVWVKIPVGIKPIPNGTSHKNKSKDRQGYYETIYDWMPACDIITASQIPARDCSAKSTFNIFDTIVGLLLVAFLNWAKMGWEAQERLHIDKTAEEEQDACV